MINYYQNITQKYCQKTHYNYVKNSRLVASSFTGKERDSETGFSYFGARYYDSDLMTGWLSVDPMADKYPNLSPYAYCAWNPVKLVDPDGEELTDFKDKNGNIINHIEDGQNVSYKLVGEGGNEYFKYESGDITNLDYQTALVIQEQQNYNMGNPSLRQTPEGQTFCNFATQNIQKAVESIPGNNNVYTTGRANDMSKAIALSGNYFEVSKDDALDYANQGRLVISSWINPNGGSGHVATLSVGTNIKEGGEYANIGPKKYSGFTSFGFVYGKNKQPSVKHYVYQRTSCKGVRIVSNKIK